MRQEVEKLLQQLSNSSALLQSGAPTATDFRSPEIAVGTLLSRYRIQAKIGEGGMGIVYRALDERLERVVALKVLRLGQIDPQHRERLLREAQMTAALNHPNIVTVYDTGSSGEIDFIAMEYVSGVALDQVISRGPPRGLCLGPWHICRLNRHAARRWMSVPTSLVSPSGMVETPRL